MSPVSRHFGLDYLFIFLSGYWPAYFKYTALAMGMMMVSPMTISLPFKLLIFLLAGEFGDPDTGIVGTGAFHEWFWIDAICNATFMDHPFYVYAGGSVGGIGSWIVIVSLVQALARCRTKLQFMIKLLAIAITLMIQLPMKAAVSCWIIPGLNNVTGGGMVEWHNKVEVGGLLHWL